MRKIRLNVEALAVTSFETREAPTARGTVYAHRTNEGWTCVYHCTFNHATCDQTCNCADSLYCTELLTSPC